jgi:hypothetical protein
MSNLVLDNVQLSNPQEHASILVTNHAYGIEHSDPIDLSSHKILIRILWDDKSPKASNQFVRELCMC